MRTPGPATKSWTLLFLWSQVGRALALQDDCVDDVASEKRHPPPPNMVVSTMSCDICPLCGELTHPLPDFLRPKCPYLNWPTREDPRTAKTVERPDGR